MPITVAAVPPKYLIESPVMTFYGECMGVALVKKYRRGDQDRYLSFSMLYEEDGCWYEMKDRSGIDSYWLPEMIEALQEAHRWLKAHARKSKDGLGWESKK